MTGPEKLSVLLPVYNTRSDWLTVAIESVLNQTYREFELLLLNDGSTNPDTLATLAAFEKADDRVRLIHNPENMGLAKTLNRGLTLARYDWVARMDGDDISEQQRFERQLAYLETHPEVSVLATALTTFGDQNEVLHYVEHHEDIAATMLWWGCCIPHPTVLYRKAAILKAGGYPTDYPNAALGQAGCTPPRCSFCRRSGGALQLPCHIKPPRVLRNSANEHNPNQRSLVFGFGAIEPNRSHVE